MENSFGCYETKMNLKDTELRLGLPGTDHMEEKCLSNFSVVRSNNKRSSPESTHEEESINKNGPNNTCGDDQHTYVPPSK
ncbi:hypothetical protein TanjilG_24572 [Lupinus angustifolius]|uniref:Uncharacterized protein n=2 Tax=Lupinus angustifolius TaxID=3871 RepID=A0A4P1RKL7_LUPAN|nr:hypothetical protein TanjilG_24572 [Lupinus angustifolius]